MATFHGHVFDDVEEVALGYPSQSFTITIGAGSAQGDVLAGTGTKYVHVFADTICQFEIGTNPTADGTSRPLPANGIGYAWAEAGDRFAVIAYQF